ncbi:MAG: NAD(P)/FAD-dependent oxidoreductase [Woeseiaceae bacterium]
MTKKHYDVVVIGAGIAGIATAYYLCRHQRAGKVLLADYRTPMSFTSAQSGDNYRNWWPHPTMTEFTNHSIDLMDEIARESSNRINLSRRGYLLATRAPEIDDIVAGLHAGYAESDVDQIRIFESQAAASYEQKYTGWETAPRGVDVLSDRQLIRRQFPSLSEEVRHIVHVRRAGDISGQQLGQYMLEHLRTTACSRLTATVQHIEPGKRFQIDVEDSDGERRISADSVVIAAGPFSKELAAQLGCDLPASNIYQQKIAFSDEYSVIPRDLPFSCDLDDVVFDWSEEERELLRDDPETKWLTTELPGGVHCRPEGGDHAAWLKIGWAYNQQESTPQIDLENEPLKNDQFPEIAMRAAARLNPLLGRYVENFPSKFIHYGGYYTMTPENWPLVGPLDVPGAYVVGALSGFGSMSACAAGELCSAWITGSSLPAYAEDLSLLRYANTDLMAELKNANSLGIL